MRQALLAGCAASVMPKRKSCSAPGTVAAAMSLQRGPYELAICAVPRCRHKAASLHFLEDVSLAGTCSALEGTAILRHFRCWQSVGQQADSPAVFGFIRHSVRQGQKHAPN